MKMLLAAVTISAAIAIPGAASAAAIKVVAAENFYGEPAQAIGGDGAMVTDIINSPDADPHDYEATPSTARAIADADIVIYNGADYDPWMDKLLAASNAPKRVVINVADLLGRKAGDNPHLWYDPAAMPAVASAVAKALVAADPTNAAGYTMREQTYTASLKAIADKVADVKSRFADAPVTATEPVFGYMAAALGLDMRNVRFQTAIMNETEPSPRDTAAIESDLKDGKVKVLFYNSQVTDNLTEHLLALARAANVAVVGVTETKPAGTTYIDWMLNTVDATEKALAGSAS